jgi:hypothetical protein
MANRKNSTILQNANGICEMANTNQKPITHIPMDTKGLKFEDLNADEQKAVKSQAMANYAKELDKLVSANNTLAVCGYKKLVRNKLVGNLTKLHKHTSTRTNIVIDTLNQLNSRRDDVVKPKLAFPLEQKGHPDHDKFMIRFDNPASCNWEPAIATPKEHGNRTLCSIAKGSPSSTVEGYINDANGGCTVDCAVGLQLSQLVSAYGPYEALGPFGKNMFDKGWKKEDICVGMFPLIKDVEQKGPGVYKAGRNPFYNSFYVDGDNKVKQVNKSIDPYGIEMAKKGRFHVVGAAGYIGLTNDKYSDRLRETTARGLNFMIVDIGGKALEEMAKGKLQFAEAKRKRRWFSSGRIDVPSWLDNITVYSHPNKKYETLREAMIHMVQINPEVEYEITLYPDTMNKMLYERFRDDYIDSCMDERRKIQAR